MREEFEGNIFLISHSLLINFLPTIHHYSHQGPTFVGTGSGAPEVPELPSAWVYNWATRPQGGINSGDCPSRLGGWA
jgi:hypothetical protein